VKNDDNIHGVLFKGVETEDTTALGVSIPRRLAEIANLKPGDRMLTYFVGGKVKMRQFQVTSVYDAMLETDDRLIVYASLADLQRLNGWDRQQVSGLEILLDPSFRNEEDMKDIAYLVGSVAYEGTRDTDESVYASSVISRYPQLFDWLGLIDFNVLFILVLMTIVAGFNMISGLLIMLFENISTIGLLKSLGMTDRSISKIFLSSSAALVLKGMCIGNVLAFVFCLVQSRTHVIGLDPENYFVSFVPVDINWGTVLAADLLSFAVIMVLLLIPCIFISRVDPADTVRVR
jgi:lipoprotein-releasing system permease protein